MEKLVWYYTGGGKKMLYRGRVRLSGRAGARPYRMLIISPGNRPGAGR
jgi:hypothetical protein